MAERSELVQISNVTTMVNALEIKKGGNRIAFGDQEDLKNISDIQKCDSDSDSDEFTHGQTRTRTGSQTCEHDQDRRFHDGNYSVSVLNYSGKKPVVVIHQENVDPCVMVEKTMHLNTATIVESAKGSVFGPSQWFSSRRTWLSSSGKRKRNRVLVWKSAGEEKSDDLNRMKEIDLTGLLYFVCDLYFDHDQIEIAYSSDGVYTLTRNNTKIGFAINLAAIFDAGGFTGMLFEDLDSDCYALVVCSPNEADTSQIPDGEEFILPMSSCLYDDMYRSFYSNGDCTDNPYYGPNGVADFDFTQLPDHIFLHIFLHLPLAQRVHCRRISQRWLPIANTALAVDTKTVDTYKEFYSKMTPDQLKSFLPLVSNCLEELTLSRRLVSEITYDTLSSITTFPALKELHFGRYLTVHNAAALFYMLDRSPKLKVLDARIPEEFPMPYDTHGPYPVENLTLCGKHSTDSRLMAFLECFPDLTQLGIISIDCFTANCISGVMEKYGSKLYQFELYDVNHDYEFQSSPPLGAVTGIQACTNLQHLLLHDTNLVSDVSMGALAAGCHKLESFQCSSEVTNGGLAALATLPNLTNLVIYRSTKAPQEHDLSAGVTAIAREGRLIVFEAVHVRLSATCLKTIVRHCRHLKRLEIYDNDHRLTMDDATEIIRLYGIWGMEPQLMFSSDDPIWKTDEVRAVIEEIKESHQWEFRIYEP